MRNKQAFTLAEVLITLGIIGVVAALTIPTLVANYQKKALVTQLKRTVATLDNGFKLMMATEGVDTIYNTEMWSGFHTESSEERVYEALKTYIPKYFKTIDICYGTSKSDCRAYSAYSSMKNLNGSEQTSGDNVNYSPYFQLSDGAIIYLSNLTKMVMSEAECAALKANGGSVCGYATFYPIAIDINGYAGPNTMGRDVYAIMIDQYGMVYDVASKAVLGNNADWEANAPGYCGTKGSSDVSQAEGYGCLARIIEEGWKMTY